MTPPPRPRAARRAASLVAAVLGAALVTAAVVARRRTGSRHRQVEAARPLRDAAPAHDQVRAVDPHLPELPQRRSRARQRAAVPASAAVPAGGAPAGTGLPLGLLSELHAKLQADLERGATGPPAPNGAAPAPGATAPPTGPGPDLPARPDVPAADLAADPGGGEQRGRRVVGAVVVTAAFVALFAALAMGRSGDDADTGGAGGAAAGAGSGTASSTPTTLGLPATPQQAFQRASERLRDAGSFSYTGTASARDVSAARPGLWLGADVAVRGAVDVRLARVQETASVPGGGMAQTVTDGAQAWGRSAADPAQLAAQPYQPVTELAATGDRLGAALVPVWLGFATGAQDAGTDGQGRPLYRATVPAEAVGVLESGRTAAAAQITLTLAPSGEPARVQVTSLPDGTALDLNVALASIGSPVRIAPPVPAG